MEFIIRIFFVLLLVLLNGYFVASEFALVAVRKTRIEELARKGNWSAKILQKALSELDQYISATQLGITFASIALGWIGEPALAHFLEPFFHFLPQEASVITAHSLAVVIAFTLITFLHIVLGELVPKSIALQQAESTSLFIIAPLALFGRIFKPFIWTLNHTGQLIVRLLPITSTDASNNIHSEEEIKILLRQSSQSGAIPAREVEMILNAFQLGDIPVKLIMVPRTDILAFNVASTLKEIIQRIAYHPHSRFPVYENTIDNIVGFIHIKDVYREMMQKGENAKLSQLKIIREIITVPEIKKIDKVLQDMRKKRIHVAIVNDEFGGTAGIVTLEDVIESLVGEIEDEFDEPLKSIVRQKDGSYLVEGTTLIEEIQEKFHLPLKGQGYMTIGGLVFGLLGHEPRVGDVVQISSVILEVKQIEGKRIKVIQLKKEHHAKK